MTSKICNYTDLKLYTSLVNKVPQEIYSPVELINSAYNSELVDEDWNYSNTNFLLLGLIIEKITQLTLVTFFTENFFEPLNLKNTFYSNTYYSTNIINRTAKSQINKKAIIEYNPSLSGPSVPISMRQKDR